MKLGTRDIESFLKTPPKCLGVLVYGPDVGLVAQRAETLAKHIVDDLSDPFRVVNLEAEALKEEGAVRVVAYITHAVLSGQAVERISVSQLDELVVTDTIPLSPAARECGRIRQLSVASLLAETIRRIRDEDSVSSLYID